MGDLHSVDILHCFTESILNKNTVCTEINKNNTRRLTNENHTYFTFFLEILFSRTDSKECNRMTKLQILSLCFIRQTCCLVNKKIIP